MKVNHVVCDTIIIMCVSVAIRSIISLGKYSGNGKSPMFGDYEAQRHWQEITFNLPFDEWYTNTTNNNVTYWGLDYPPLTAYHSLLNGYIASKINSSYITLNESKGIESKDHKLFMRWTVLIADILLFLPSCYLVMSMVVKNFKGKNFRTLLVIITLYPGLILIDNGHFQYNNISLGFMLLGVTFILSNSNYMAAIFFSLALNYKQMELYHAIPFFLYLLKECIKEKSYLKKLHKFVQIAAIVSITFLVIWIPWLNSYDSTITVLRRLFPITRGIFEDKVANFWCSLHVIYKFRNILSHTHTMLICLITTLLAILPSSVNLFWIGKKTTFLYALSNIALGFFLFSYHVHEKSILLAAIPAACLFNFMPIIVISFLKISTFSLLPLLIKDELQLQYFALLIAYSIMSYDILEFSLNGCNKKKLRNLTTFQIILDISIFTMSCMALYVKPPKQLPDLWSVIISGLCCGFFTITFIIGHIKQFKLMALDESIKKKTR